MNIRAVKEREIVGTFGINAAKSDAIRRLLLAAFSFNKCEIRNVGKSEDVVYTLNALYSLGAEIIKTHEGFLIELKNIYTTEIEVGESALLLRCMMSILSALGVETKIRMGDQLKNRPHDELIDALNSVGAKITRKDEYITIEGKADLSNISIPCDKTSQYVSSLLIAGAIVGNAKIKVVGKIASAGYIGVTRKILNEFGVKLSLVNNNEIVVNNRPHIDVTTCENDYSSAAPFLTLGVIGDVVISNLDSESLQPDRRILEALTLSGAKVEKGRGIRVKQQESHPFTFDVYDCPDIGPVVAMLMATIKGESTLTGLENLRYKESNRLNGIINALKAVNVKCKYEDEKLTIYGGTVENGEVNAQCDHRLVMAFVVLSILANKEIIIKNAEGIRKSNPDFFVQLGNIGAFAEMLWT